MPAEMPAELLKPYELADRLKVTLGTIGKWRKAGLIPFTQIGPTTYRFDYSAVVDALRTRAAAPDPGSDATTAGGANEPATA